MLKKLSPIEEVIKDAAAGRMFILVDDEDRENEGDPVIACNVDADNFTGTGFANLLAMTFLKDAKCYMRSYNMKKAGTGGRIAVSRTGFYRVGGYDETYSTWSPDDCNFAMRLENAGFKKVPITDAAFKGVITHGDDVRFANYEVPVDRTAARKRYVELISEDSPVRTAKVTKVNNGSFGNGIVTRNFSSEAIMLEPLKQIDTRVLRQLGISR